MDYDDCIKKKLLIPIEPNPDLVVRTIEMADSDLDESILNFEEGRLVWSLVQAYTSMLNYARALMFSEGIREKSHLCSVEYLRTYHGDDYGYLLNAFDSLRRDRHSMIYDSRTSISRDNVERAIEWCKEFKERTEMILSKNRTV